MRTLPYRSEPERAAAAAELGRHLRSGGVIVYPTETVYGLGCVPEPEALARLARLKGRPPEKPFLLLVRRPEDAPALEWTPPARRLAERFWPGPLTLVLADRAGCWPEGVRGPDGTVALRASPHPAVAAILDVAGPVTSTSANRPGEAAATDAAAAAAAVDAEDDEVLVLDGGTLPPSPASTIVDCTGGPVRLVRAGALAVDELRDVVEVENGRP